MKAICFGLCLCISAATYSQTPRPRPILSTNGRQVMLVDRSGETYLWGQGDLDLGNGEKLDPEQVGLDPSRATVLHNMKTFLEPQALRGLPKSIRAIEGDGPLTYIAVLDDGSVWVLGRDTHLRLGLTPPGMPLWKQASINLAKVPTRIPDIADAIDVRLGPEHVLVLLRNGTVLQWGAMNVGTPDDTRKPILRPEPVPGLRNAVAIAAGGQHSLALLADGSVVAWGRNTRGQLGNGTFVNATAPVRVTGISDAVAIAAGEENSYAVLSNGTVVAWGDNVSDGLAQPHGADGVQRSNTPVRIPKLPPIQSLSAGAHVLALARDGSVWSWGHDGYGNLGTGHSGTTENPAVTGPFRVEGVVHPVALTAWRNCSIALLPDGTIKMWGGFPYWHPVLSALNRTQSSAVPETVTRLLSVP